MNLSKLHILAGLLLLCSGPLYASAGSLRDAVVGDPFNADLASSNELLRFEIDCVEAALDRAQGTWRHSRGNHRSPDPMFGRAIEDEAAEFWQALENKKRLNFALLEEEYRILKRQFAAIESRAEFRSAYPWRDMHSSSGRSTQAGIKSRVTSVALCLVRSRVGSRYAVLHDAVPMSASRMVDVRTLLHLYSIRNGYLHRDGLFIALSELPAYFLPATALPALPRFLFLPIVSALKFVRCNYRRSVVSLAIRFAVNARTACGEPGLSFEYFEIFFGVRL